jgi:predicted DNA-binding ribbon-helix-helix protein
MYILFKAVNEQQQGIVQTVGRVLNYTVGQLIDTHTDIADYNHLNPKVLPENVALAWKFFGTYRDYISVRTGTLQNEQLQIINSAEATGEKEKYFLTDEDKANAAEFMKAVMRMMLDEVYDKRFVQANLTSSTLESSTWAEQRKEAEAYNADSSAPVPMLTALAQSRAITVAEMVEKVNSAIAAYNDKIAQLLANKQAREQEIKACQTVADCNRMLHNRFDLTMPGGQQQAEGITTGSKFDL